MGNIDMRQAGKSVARQGPSQTWWLTSLLPSVGRRVLQAIPLVCGLIAVSFLLLHLAPGDIADVLAGEAGVGDASQMAELRRSLGLEQPVHVQLANYLSNL